MSIFGSIFGSDKSKNDILDKDSGLLSQLGGWVGKSQFTEEEKSISNAKTRDWAIRQLDAMAPFKVTQRLLAAAVTLLWVTGGLAAIGSIGVEAFFNQALTEGEPELVLVGPLITFLYSDYIVYPTFMVYALFFGGGVIDSVKRKLTT